MIHFRTEALTVGYNGKPLIRDIEIELEQGKILTLIGPNGAGKSTILKSITRQLPLIGGCVYLAGKSLTQWPARELAKQAAVVLTDRIRPELMTCSEVVAMGRYPYTNMFGKLMPEDVAAVERALDRVHGRELAQQDFATLSDGQRQRIMLARAICQEPQIIILDEPTAYLDIRYKVELLDILRGMAQEGITVIMSLHEIDLAAKVSDYLLCVRGDRIAGCGTPAEVLTNGTVESLYSMEKGSYNALLGSVELARPEGEPEVFVIAGGGYGIPVFRQLQKENTPFAAGILFDNDIDFQVAKTLAAETVSCPAFTPMEEKHFEEAFRLMLRCGTVIDAGTPIGALNEPNARLLQLAREQAIPVMTMEQLQKNAD